MSDTGLNIRALRSTVALPGMALIVIPGLILWWTDSFNPGWDLSGWIVVLPYLFGILLFGPGLTLLFSTIRLFASRGKGTLAPWDPPEHLVVEGPYRYVRNPMHSGVFHHFVRGGIAAWFNSHPDFRHSCFCLPLVLHPVDGRTLVERKVW